MTKACKKCSDLWRATQKLRWKRATAWRTVSTRTLVERSVGKHFQNESTELGNAVQGIRRWRKSVNHLPGHTLRAKKSEIPEQMPSHESNRLLHEQRTDKMFRSFRCLAFRCLPERLSRGLCDKEVIDRVHCACIVQGLLLTVLCVRSLQRSVAHLDNFESDRCVLRRQLQEIRNSTPQSWDIQRHELSCQLDQRQ